MQREAVAVVAVIAILISAGAAFVLGPSIERTATPSTTWHPTSTAIQTQSSTSASVTSFSTTFQTVSSTSTCTGLPNVMSCPWVWSYLSSSPGCAAGPSMTGPWTPYPCWSTFASDAVVFYCVAAAAEPEGCTQQVYIRNYTASFNVTVWYPFYNANVPGANCTWNVNNPQLETSPPAAFCLPLNATSFLIAEPRSTTPT